MTEAGFRQPQDVVAMAWERLSGLLGRGRDDVRSNLRATPVFRRHGQSQLSDHRRWRRGGAAPPAAWPDSPGANDMKREHTVLNRLWSAFPMAPRSLFYCADEDVLGAHFLIMEIGYPLRSRDVQYVGMANPASHPEGGVDYPRTLTEFDAWFVSETACAEFLGRVRWPEGFRCPSCCGTDAWPTARGQLRCNRCQRQTSVTAGTIFQGTRKPLRLWFQAMWYVTNQKHGVSALGLQRILGLGQLSDRLGLAAQVAARHGEAGA